VRLGDNDVAALLEEGRVLAAGGPQELGVRLVEVRQVVPVEQIMNNNF
jgi:hypothetical protein